MFGKEPYDILGATVGHDPDKASLSPYTRIGCSLEWRDVITCELVGGKLDNRLKKKVSQTYFERKIRCVAESSGVSSNTPIQFEPPLNPCNTAVSGILKNYH